VGGGPGAGGAAPSGGGTGDGGAASDGGAVNAGGQASSGGSGTGGGREPPPPGPNGEKYPFPMNVTYPHGVMSTKIDNAFVKTWYENWRGKYVKSCNGNLLPSTETADTAKVEAQGFGMLAAAYMGDKPTLDELYAFYEAKLVAGSCGLMGWHSTCGGFQDQGAATDGDIDVASALIVAHWQWPNDGYDAKANEVIAKLKTMILDCSGTSALYPGCSGGNRWGGCNETDISYYSPAFFRYFAEISGDDAWNKLADDSHVIRDNGAHESTGLVPDWQSVSGTPGAGSRVGHYGFDAIRTPFKHGLDFLWHGNEKAEAWCQKISTWANGVGVTNLRDSYQLNGSVIGSNHNMAVVGSMAVCALANTQAIADAFVAETVKRKDDFWYSGYLGNLYLLALSGNMWTPEIAGY
jgi:endoglucanase